jgi:hypothetical protein
MNERKKTGVLLICALFTAAVLAAACESEQGTVPFDAFTEGDGGELPYFDKSCNEMGYSDSDGDKIPDLYEGSEDTDGDTLPDSYDRDSDNDGLGDGDEAGPGLCVVEPPDSDYDGMPDFQDSDSDNNGRPDGVDGKEDVDGDGVENYRDRDDDDDGIDDSVEIGPDPSDPVDSDGDGIPDFWDQDSDNDTINDVDERRGDADFDGVANFRDTDSDNDTIPDRDEAGDLDPSTPPVDSDGDGSPDFLDIDSDNDGLDDGLEYDAMVGCSPTMIDTDGDGFTDLAEYTVGTDCADSTSKYEGFYLILPYRPGGEPEVRTFDFSTEIRMADIFFLIDSTGSMYDEIDTIKARLQDTIVPGIVAEIPDAWIGLGELRDECDDGYFPVRVRQNVTNSIPLIQAAIDAFTDGGGCGYTTLLEALYQMVTGEGFGAHLPPAPGCLDAGWGYPCFRIGALPIFIAFSDAEARGGPSGTSWGSSIIPTPHTYAAVVNSLNDVGARFIGVDSGEADVDMRALSIDTGTVSVSGSPLLFEISSAGTGIDDTIVEAVVTLANQVAFDVDTAVEERPYVDDGVDATEFVKRVTPFDANPAENIVGFDTVTFYGVLPGTILTFEVAFLNDFVPEEPMPRAFWCKIVVRANRTASLDEKNVLIIVPGEKGILE